MTSAVSDAFEGSLGVHDNHMTVARGQHHVHRDAQAAVAANGENPARHVVRDRGA